MFDLTERCALVTGASGGIGEAIARKLYARGATLTLSGTRQRMLESLRVALRTRVPGTHVFVFPCNLSEAESVERLVTEAESAMGRVDILVNSAGVTRDSLILRMKDDDWARVMDVNLTAAFRLSRAVVRGMIKRRFGRMVHITSIVGITGNPGQVNYAAAKAGMIGMTKSLAAEVAARNITVNCVAPGFITTAMTDTLSEVQRNKLISGIPAGRFGVPEDIAAATLFLVSPEAGYITGQTLHINGGMAMV